MAGFKVHQYYKKANKCSTCLNFLTSEKDYIIELPKDSEYKYLELKDRGSLKWPSMIF